jgi:glycine/D-amino acid oxidase-like deaminating enzyme
MRRRDLIFAIGGGLIGLLAATHLTLRAQGDPRARADAPAAAATSVQDALLRPWRFPFKEPITLSDLAARLGRELNAPVVLDLSALDRLDLKPEGTVRLELDTVRLKTGLKLLLDQVGMTFRVIPEDNLLILTDREGAEDPLERLAAEVRELHRDVHDVQDALDEVRDLLGSGDGARVRKPTIIEELPDEAEGKRPERGDEPTRPAPRPGPEPHPPGAPSHRPRTRL